MSYLRTAAEVAIYERTFYRGTEVYVNKLGIRDLKLLEDTERMLTDRRAAEGFPTTAHHKSYAGFKAIHRHLFQDLYAWAGKERRYTTGRGPVPFAVPEHIGSWMREQFRKLARDRHLAGRDRTAFAAAAGEYVNEINAGHAFIDGNGRTQRFWLRMLANNAGFELTLTSRDARRWNEASRLGFLEGNHKPMARLIEQRLKVLPPLAPDDNPAPQGRRRRLTP
nr:Fic family protein [uncultured Rhodopila sp.]